jgi:hypothetical protein
MANNPLVVDTGATVSGPGQGLSAVADQAGLSNISGHSQGDSGRAQRELEDRRAQVNAEQGVDPRITALLNNPYNANATSAQLIDRYGAVNQAGTSDAANFTRQIYGDTDKLGQSAYDEMAQQLGRAPTADEWNQLYQAWQGPNGTVNGRAAVSQYAQQIKNDPNNPNSSLNPNNAGYGARVAPQNQAVTQQFQSILGRAPTADELQHFSGILASGQTDAYGLQSFLKTQPEYMNAQDTQFRSGVNDQLQSYDTAEFNKEKTGVMADYASRGFGTGNSPSLDYALTDLMGKLASNRSAYLAQLSSQQYGGNKDVATQGYQTSLNQMYDQSQQNTQRQNSLTDYYTQRGNQGADYMTQMNDFLNYQNANKGKSINPLYGAAGTLAGTPFGATGQAAGNAAGTAYGYLNR